jgi:hypothetical protein
MIVLTIPELTPSLNVTRAGHWRTRHRRRKHWSMLVLVAKSEARVYDRPPAVGKARVIVERHGGRRLDQDNAVGGLKDLVDGLRDNGFIVDDDPEHLELQFVQYPGVRKEGKTIIRIEAA